MYILDSVNLDDKNQEKDKMMKLKPKNIQLKDGQIAIVRSAMERDAEQYLQLGKSIMSEEIFTLTQVSEMKMTIDQEKSWIQSNIDNKNHIILVVEKEDKLIGQIDFSNGHRQRIEHTGAFGMGVHKDFRGQGVGSIWLQELITWATAHHTIEKINLCVHHTNTRAISMYKKFGFQKEGVRTKDLKYGHDQYVDTVLMGLWVKNIEDL